MRRAATDFTVQLVASTPPISQEDTTSIETGGAVNATLAVSALSILDVRVHQLTAEDALRLIGTEEALGSHKMLSYVNAHTLNLATHDEELRDALNRCQLTMNDGMGLNLAARMQGERFPENMHGSDFTVRLLELAASRDWKVFFLGGEPGVAETAAARLTAEIDGLQVVGTCHGFTGESDEVLTQRVKDSDASLLIVALGSPRQELFLHHNLKATGAAVGIGVGAFLDFTAGKVARAPRWMNVLGVEWCFRLMQEPGRLWRRYIVGNPAFLLRAWHNRPR